MRLIYKAVVKFFLVLSPLVGISRENEDSMPFDPWIIENSSVNPISSVSVESYDDQYVSFNIIFKNSQAHGWSRYIVENRLEFGHGEGDGFMLVVVPKAINTDYEIMTPRLKRSFVNVLKINSKHFTDTTNSTLLNEAEYLICLNIC